MIATVIICVILAAVVTLALRSVIRTRKNGGCGCGCADCPHKCKDVKKNAR